MGITMKQGIRHSIVKQKIALMLDITQGKATASEECWAYDLSPLKKESWVEDGKNSMENPFRAMPKIQERFAKPVKNMMAENTSFSYRTIAWLLGFNTKTIKHIFQLRGWQIKKRSIGFRPRVEALPSVPSAPNERWFTVLCYVWADWMSFYNQQRPHQALMLKTLPMHSP